MKPKKESVDTSVLRNFYFSGASNFSTFHKKSVKSSSSPSTKLASIVITQPHGSSDGLTSTTMTISAAEQNQASDIVTEPSGTETAMHGMPVESASHVPAAGSGIKAARQSRPSQAMGEEEIEIARGTLGLRKSNEAVSSNYIDFLQMQRDMTKVHVQSKSTLASLLCHVQEQRNTHDEETGRAENLLQHAELSTDWNWKSKFTREQLLRDAELSVPLEELLGEDTLPQLDALKQTQQQFVQLRRQERVALSNADHAGEVASSTALNHLLDTGIRRLDRLLNEYSGSQLDATPAANLCDHLVVQLDHILTIQPLSVVLEKVDASIAAISRKQEESARVRDQAHEDGSMDIAEREAIRLVELGEEAAQLEVERLRLLSSLVDEHNVTLSVRNDYVQAAEETAGEVIATYENLKKRCEEDLAKLYQLKRQMDDREERTCEKIKIERQQSDERLSDIKQQKDQLWLQMEGLAKQLQDLEQRRHEEYRLRTDQKIKDETCRNEYSVFNSVTSEYASLLNRTVMNAETQVNCIRMTQSYIQSGFQYVDKFLKQKLVDIEGEQLQTHKQHLAVVRRLLFTVGELSYRKGKRIEEVDSEIQTAHVQQELCHDSLNPSAKRFSDTKKSLLRLRDQLELEHRELKLRQKAAEEQYAPTESALVAAGVEHPHPVEEMEAWLLETREKMAQYRLISLGNVSSEPLKTELSLLRKTFTDSQRTFRSTRD